jgi:hypothetical protein
MPKTVQLTKRDVENALRNVLDLDGAGNHDAFDLFLSRPIADTWFEAIRTECLAVCLADRHRPRGRDLGEKSEQWIQRKLNELQSKSLGI